ncbi:MAG TPA: glycosyltransferase family 9 protein [Bryobacteraceae bacterium]|jgi:heptosyltransferase-2|nr:glycosyltransferase family 9 protein [Bryobacteraceae bacterium]
MTKRILIIKLGALGDVIRTTPLLRALDGDVTWVTSSLALPLLRNSPAIATLVAKDELRVRPAGKYDLVVNLEDDIESAKLASAAVEGDGTIVGPYMNATCVTYDASSSEWFDMSLSSRHGRELADALKMRNRKTYQEMIFAALGLIFRGEDPVLNLPLRKTLVRGLVGIEERAGGVWPNKQWNRYRELADRLEALGYRTRSFEQRESVIDYVDDINECEFVICGDTLAMHIALALRRQTIALFTCTSPHEIHGYGRLRKIVSPLLDRYFYKREYSPEAANAITLAEVESCFRMIADRPTGVRQTQGRHNDERKI